MKKDGTSRKEKAVQTKNKIYASAEYLFNLRGFDAVNIDDIVEHAGVAKGSFYVHFESRNALIATIISNYVNKVDMGYKAYIDSLPPDMRINEKLLSLVGKIADVIINSIGCENMKLLYRTQLEKDVHAKPAASYDRELYKLVFRLIDQGYSELTFRSELSAEETAKHFIMAYRGLVYEWCVRYPEIDLKEQALRHFKILLAGISR